MSEIICPHCKNPIYDDDALSCMFCGEPLQRSIGLLGAMKYGISGYVGIVVTIVVVVVFIAIYIL